MLQAMYMLKIGELLEFIEIYAALISSYKDPVSFFNTLIFYMY